METKMPPVFNANRSDKTPVRKINENPIGPCPARCREGYYASVEFSGKPTRIVVKSLGCARKKPKSINEQGKRKIVGDGRPHGIRTPFSETVSLVGSKACRKQSRRSLGCCGVPDRPPPAMVRESISLEVPEQTPFPSSHQL